MINNIKIIELIKSDARRYFGGMGFLKCIFYVLINKNHSFTYTFWLRLCNKSFLLWPIARMIHMILSSWYGIHIPPYTKIGKGFYMNHGFGIFVNSTAVIGKNCNISQLTTIGSNKGTAAVIGDNVYIGPNVCIVENVKIGNNVNIGAGAVETKSIPSNSTAIGVPAKVIGPCMADFIQNKV